jgi:hypothetical protein
MGARGARRKCFELIIKKKQMSFGGDYGKDTGTYMTAVKDAIAAMVAAIPEVTIKDETNEFDDKEFTQEYKKIYIVESRLTSEPTPLRRRDEQFRMTTKGGTIRLIG